MIYYDENRNIFQVKLLFDPRHTTRWIKNIIKIKS